MKKLMLICLGYGVLMTYPSNGQFYFHSNKYYENALVIETGGSIGLMNCLTDLGEKTIFLKNSKPAAGIYVSGVYQGKIGVRLEATFGELTAYDNTLKNNRIEANGRFERNLSFKSRINDFQLSAELYPLMYFINENSEPLFLMPYLMAGAGLFHFNPKASLNGRWHELQPLRTEGQGFREYPDNPNYKLTQANISLGGGVKYEVSALVTTRIEFNYRFLFTDYLDDASTNYINPDLFSKYLSPGQAALAKQLYSRKSELNPSESTLIGSNRGNPNNKDSYFSILLKVGIVLGRVRK